MLQYLSTLSEIFQSGGLKFSRIKPAIEKTTHRIKNLAEKQKLLIELKQDITLRHILRLKALLARNEQQVRLYQEKYAESVIDNIHACFTKDMLSTLRSFSFSSSSDSKNLKYMAMRQFASLPK